MTRNRFLHRGDLGDVIAALPTMKALGGGDIIIGPQIGKDQGRESLKGSRFDAIRPLLEAQNYIGNVSYNDDPKDFTHDFTHFRNNFQVGENLLDWQARHIGIQVPSDPWLTALRSPKSIGRTVVARSLRYRNPGFPWHAVMAKHRNCLFVGTEEEYKDFSRSVKRIDFEPTKDLLELAEIIGGSHLFVGNQSCPFWIAAGLGVALIQEVWAHSPNSQVKRPNARYLMRGPFSL